VVKVNELRFALTSKSPIRELADPDQQKERRNAYRIGDAISKLRKEKVIGTELDQLSAPLKKAIEYIPVLISTG
jgi:hypothetical protein